MEDNNHEIEFDRVYPLDIENYASGVNHVEFVYERMSEEEVRRKMQGYEQFQSTHSVPKGNFPEQGFAISLKRYVLPELYVIDEVNNDDGTKSVVHGLRPSSGSLDELLIGEHTEDGKLMIHGIVHPWKRRWKVHLRGKGRRVHIWREEPNPVFYSKITRNVEKATVVPVAKLFREIPQLKETTTLITKSGIKVVSLADLISGAASSIVSRAQPTAVTLSLPAYSLNDHLRNTRDAYAKPIYGGKFRIIIE